MVLKCKFCKICIPKNTWVKNYDVWNILPWHRRQRTLSAKYEVLHRHNNADSLADDPNDPSQSACLCKTPDSDPDLVWSSGTSGLSRRRYTRSPEVEWRWNSRTPTCIKQFLKRKKSAELSDKKKITCIHTDILFRSKFDWFSKSSQKICRFSSLGFLWVLSRWTTNLKEKL